MSFSSSKGILLNKRTFFVITFQNQGPKSKLFGPQNYFINFKGSFAKMPVFRIIYQVKQVNNIINMIYDIINQFYKNKQKLFYIYFYEPKQIDSVINKYKKNHFMVLNIKNTF